MIRRAGPTNEVVSRDTYAVIAFERPDMHTYDSMQLVYTYRLIDPNAAVQCLTRPRSGSILMRNIFGGRRADDS